jgi:hypothetical protein
MNNSSVSLLKTLSVSIWEEDLGMGAFLLISTFFE